MALLSILSVAWAYQAWHLRLHSEVKAPRLNASYIEVQSTYLIFALESGETPRDLCARLEETRSRAQDLIEQTLDKPTLLSKAQALMARINTVHAECRKPSPKMRDHLYESRSIAQELSRKLSALAPIKRPAPQTHASI